MKKAVLLVFLIGTNFLVSCTDDDLSEIQQEIDTYANGDTGGGNGGEEGQLDPPDAPPTGN